MADFFKNVFGGSKDVPAAKVDSDFADFAGAPDPVPEPAPAAGTLAATASSTTVPWTAWYNVHERHSLSEFKFEGFILLFGGVILVLHLFGSRLNRNKARAFIRAHAPALVGEFACVGFEGRPNTQSGDVNPEALIKEKSLFEFATYATGRQNVAFADVKITLTKKFNPIILGFETVAAYFFDTTFDMPYDVAELYLYPFDGQEAKTVPGFDGPASSKSGYDSFVWAVVNKDVMQKVREARYDVSLTATKESPKLPNWLTVMSESAEITDALLTPELISAIVAAGEDNFEYLLITDQPTDKPKTLDETKPSKRIILKYRLPSNNDYNALSTLFHHTLQLPDFLVQHGSFRPEVLRKVRATRDNMSKELRKAAEEEKNEERILEREKAKKAKRDAELAALDAKAQKKYLEREQSKEMRKAQKKQVARA